MASLNSCEATDLKSCKYLLELIINLVKNKYCCFIFSPTSVQPCGVLGDCFYVAFVAPGSVDASPSADYISAL